MAQRLESNRNGSREQANVYAWRRAQFLHLGFARREAETLARAPVDLNLVRKILAAGCPLDTARRIVL